MSDGPRLPYAEAYARAQRLVDDLAPHVVRCKVAGSLRRKRPDVGDIEIVVEPRMREGMFISVPDVDAIRAVASRWGLVSSKEKPDGSEKMLKVRLYEPADFKVELYIVTPPAEWACILAIRTGPAKLGEWAMTRMKQRGYRHTCGHVETADGARVDVPDEEAFFRLAGLRCVAPSLRDTDAAMRPVAV
ncbi:MAG TPA: hypothetical protein VFJ16_08300 [Longimicrobium sp.]|nr:hypothetical protein [Longimicrobium sp.]